MGRRKGSRRNHRSEPGIDTQMQSPPRHDNLPVPYTPVTRGPLAERVEYPRWNGNGHPYGYGYAPPPAPHPELVHGSHSTYFQVLLQRILGRWKILAVWTVVTVFAAFFILTKYAKPTWKAEGVLYYSPDHSYSHKRLYTPPNIQTILALTKSPDILDKVSKEFGATDVSTKLNVSLVKSSDLIAVTYEAADKQKAEAVVSRAMALAIEQYDQLRHRLSKDAITDLDESLERSRTEVLAMRGRLNEAMGNKGIVDLRSELSNVLHEIADYQKEIKALEREEDAKKIKKAELERRIREAADGANKKDGPLSEVELARLGQIREAESRKNVKRVDLETAKIELKANEETYRKLLPLYRANQLSRQEWGELEVKLSKNRLTIENLTSEIAKDEEIIERLKTSGVSALPVVQASYEIAGIDAELASIPGKIKAIQAYRKEREAHLMFLQSAEKEATRIQQEIDTLQLRYNNLVAQKQEHEKLESNKGSGELSIHANASAGGAPASSNSVKLGAATFGLSLLLFVGLIALFDMPKTATATPSPVAAVEPGLPPPGSQLPVPIWYHQQAVPMPQYAPPPAHPHAPGNAFVNEHLRALAERIAFNPLEDKGKIVLFTPTARGLGVENLLGDLACHLIRETGRVLVFEARADIENPAFPAWTGPSAREATEHAINYLEGRSERSAGCFAETLISQIDYARADLSRHLQSVMAMYRFRRLVNEMRDRYSLVLMITPERYRGEDDDVFTTLGDGIVVVINQDADPADVEQYLRSLSACETPVYGAFTVPTGGAGHPSRA
jgi:capsular polysaccharide biosynthesis protein